MSAIADTAPDRSRVTLAETFADSQVMATRQLRKVTAPADVRRLPVRSAGDLRAPVPLRVRRRDQDGARELRQLPDAGNHRDDRDLRRADDRASG